MKEDEKSAIKPPFSVYDFFGYLIPAFVFLIAVYLFESSARVHFPNLYQPLQSVLIETYPAGASSPTQQVFFFLGLTFAAYVLGHVIATVSSMLLDRILVSKAHGYPFENLLMKKEGKPRREEATQNVYRGAFAWANIVIWSAILATTFQLPPVLSITLPKLTIPIDFEPVRTWVFAFGTIVAAPLVIYALINESWPRKSLAKWPRTILGISRVYASPYNCAWWVLNRFFDWDEPLHPATRISYQNSFRKTFARDATDAKTDNYWFTSFYIAEKSPSVYKFLQNWFFLYSFARNVSAAFYLSFLYVGVYMAFARSSGFENTPTGKACCLGIAGTYFGISLILAIRYHYLYFSYYSKNLFRAFVYLRTLREAEIQGGGRSKFDNEPGGTSSLPD